MKLKSILLTALATISLATATMAQVPNYVPTNGLVGWWPFNGNANDESLNGNNGMVSGASLMNDRNGVANSSYSFDGVDDKIDCGNGLSLNQFTSELTVAAWIKAPQTVNTDKNILSKYGCNPGGWSLETSQNTFAVSFTGCNQSVQSQFNLYNDTWIHIIGVREANKWKVYKNGLLEDSSAIFANYNLNSAYNLIIGVQNDNLNPSTHWEGQIDDIGIWNRALTQQEITNLYNGNICYQTITVTDTLLINVGLTGLNPVTYNNTIKIFPNPTNDHITIDYGNISSLNGYQLKITNSLGQQMFQTAINQQTSYISLASWTGNGLYFVHIIDPQGNTIDIRKIVLQ